jgi:hypothetical protein
LIRAIYDYFGYDPAVDVEKPPVVMQLIGNKADLYPDKEATTRPPTEKLLRAIMSSAFGRYIVCYEASALKSDGVVKIFRELSHQIASNFYSISQI